nr:uncharacterized serine-rich protein C215.13-like [Ipomoea batatas]
MEGTSGHENDDLPCISLDLEKAINLSCNPTQNINPPRVRLVKPRALSFENPVGRVCRSPGQTAPDAATIGGVSANSPRMNSSRKFFNSITVRFWAIICRGPSCSQNGRVGRQLTQALNFPNNKGKRHCAILVDYPHPFQEIPWLPRRRRNGGQKGGRSGLNQGRRSRGLRRVCYVCRGIDSGGGGIGDNDSGGKVGNGCGEIGVGERKRRWGVDFEWRQRRSSSLEAFFSLLDLTDWALLETLAALASELILSFSGVHKKQSSTTRLLTLQDVPKDLKKTAKEPS